MIEISDLAKLSGQPASALRYYEQRGLIKSTGRKGLRRLFNSDTLERLSLIALGRAAGFSLDEIRDMFVDSPEFEINRDKLREKADELDQTIKELSMIRNALRHTADCPAPSHMECPNFRRIMKAAGDGLIPPLGLKEKTALRLAPIKTN